MYTANRTHLVAQQAWEALNAYNVAPTPRNYEVWFSYCGNDKPKLAAQLDKLIKNAGPLTPGVLDALFSEFFADAPDFAAIARTSCDLREIASEIAERVKTDRTAVEAYADALASVPGMREELGQVGERTVRLGGRMRSLEAMLATSVARIHDLEEKLEQSDREANRDALTGLANRRFFETAIRQAATQAASSKSELSLLILDIDHFKQFNDRYGHRVGDQVLRLVGAVLRNHLKGRDTAARYGGEEFAILLAMTDQKAATTVAEQIRVLLRSRQIVNRATGENLGTVTCSIGVATYRPGEEIGDLIDRADQAMYRAKHTGRDKICTEERD